MMIRNLLATTALAALVATGAAYAQQATTPAPSDTQQTQPAPVKAEGFLATNIIGENVYNGNGDNAERIGDVNDMVIANDGQIQSVVVGVGGFLGMGERSVAVPFEKLSWSERNGDRWLVYPATRDQLQAMPEFDRRAYEPASGGVASNDTGTSAPATNDNMAAAPANPAPADQAAQDTTAQPATPAPADQQAQNNNQPDTTTTGAIDKSKLKQVPADQLTTEQDLIGTTVYGANDENIGEISDVVMSQDGKVDAVVVDVGGFLGIGEKKVAVGFDKLQFMADEDGDKYVYTPFTKEQLNAQTAYDEGTYAQNRDQQRLVIQ